MAKVVLPDGLGFMAHMLDRDGNRVGLMVSHSHDSGRYAGVRALENGY